jgi:lipopolysaccharide export system protein LptA
VIAPLLVALALAAPEGAPAKPAPAATPKASASTSSTTPTKSAAPAGKAVPVDVQAASIEYRYKERRTVMTGDPLVTLTREDATLVCKRLVAEMDAAGQIARATCEGDVKLTRAERVVTCESATFENATGRVTCVGTPELRDGPSVVRGERLVYDLDEDRVTLTRARGTVVQSAGQELPLGGTRR